MFASVPDVLEPLDYFKLPAFLPVSKPVSHLYPWDVYAELRKLKPAKASGPDNCPPKLAKEFAYELSVPLTDIVNSSFREGKVP